MTLKVRCPCCGRLAWPSQIRKEIFKLQVYDAISLGKSHGFRHELSEDASLVELLKLKIMTLYDRFIKTVEKPSVAFVLKPDVKFVTMPDVDFRVYPMVR